ncbi:class I glutamine amidotransferase-like protein [Thelonectria olida]|uniref:Class I glutamine amidotransferase-like protein n=1 Tax=Thelonectria olida TaxID=1576542 RepID=A0A9P9AXK7_9HYPO|nr:class I glutamine amidotransferase-like protein [Thelonectria olida]
MTATLDFKNPGRRIQVGVILLGTTEVLDVAPIDLLHGLDRKFIDTFPDFVLSPELKAQGFDFDFHWVSETGKSPSLLTSGIQLVPTDSFETCPPLDVVLIGAAHVGYEPKETELAFIRKVWAECSAFITICGGMDAPLKAGILEGKTATAPLPLITSLREQAPGTNWVEKRWVRDGKLWTSGALLNGLDLMRNFCLETWGGEEGSLVDRMLRFGAWPVRDVDYKDDI